MGHKSHHLSPHEGEAEGDLTQTEEGQPESKGEGHVTTEEELVVM